MLVLIGVLQTQQQQNNMFKVISKNTECETDKKLIVDSISTAILVLY